MSAFGAVDIDIHESKVDFLVSSANKCIEGVQICILQFIIEIS